MAAVLVARLSHSVKVQTAAVAVSNKNKALNWAVVLKAVPGVSHAVAVVVEVVVAVN